MSDANQSISVRSFLVRLFVAAFLLNWIWEIAQIYFYIEGGNSWREKFVGCTLATVGDALLTLLAYGIGALITGNRRWGIGGGWKVYLILAVCGAVFAIVIEWLAQFTNVWTYKDLMPRVPILNVGILPFLQLTILIPIALRLAVRRRKPNLKRIAAIK